MIKKELFYEIKQITKNLKDQPIGIQIPEGLKQYSLEILDKFKKYNPILFVDPCFGACDLKDKEAKELGCKVLLHFGHYKMGSPIIKTEFIPLNYKLRKGEIEFIVKNVKKMKINKINLVTTIQYLSNIEIIKSELERNNIKVIKCKKTNRLKKHMVLGCDCSTITDSKHPIIFIGDGSFHANNLAFIYNTQKIYAISPITKKVKEIKINKDFIRRRYMLTGIAQSAKSFGILVSTKNGQQRLNLAKEIKIKLMKHNKKVYIFVSDYIKQEYLYGIKVDCYINTACPRITYDDYNLFRKPIISPSEVDMIIDTKKELKIDQIN